MNASYNRVRISIIGLVALAIGVGIGVAGTKFRAGTSGARKPALAATNQMSSALPGGANSSGATEWDPFQEIQNLQAQMNQSFNRMFEQFRMDPQFNMFQGSPGYSLSLDVRNLKHRYEVRAFLPDARASNVHVSLKNGQTLKVEVKSKQAQVSHQPTAVSQVAQWGKYEQTIQLPTPVKADQMKIRREGHELIITIPKAT